MIFESHPTVVVAMSATELRDNLAGELTADGFEVLVADSVAGIEARAVSAVPDLLVIGELDEPGSACEVVRGLRDGRLMDGRADPALPCVAITVDDRLTTLLRFFDAGSDDVVSLPLRYPELLARVRAVLRRRIELASAFVSRIGALELNRPARSVSVAGAEVALSAKEFSLLCTLASDPDRVFTKEELMRDIWGWATGVGGTRTLDSHACRLRQKLSRDGDRFVVNVWGVGYRLVDRKPVGASA